VENRLKRVASKLYAGKRLHTLVGVKRGEDRTERKEALRREQFPTPGKDMFGKGGEQGWAQVGERS